MDLKLPCAALNSQLSPAPQCLKCRTPVQIIAIPRSFAAAITSGSFTAHVERGQMFSVLQVEFFAELFAWVVEGAGMALEALGVGKTLAAAADLGEEPRCQFGVRSGQ